MTTLTPQEIAERGAAKARIPVTVGDLTFASQTECAKHFGVSNDTVSRWRKKGYLHRLGDPTFKPPMRGPGKNNKPKPPPKRRGRPPKPKPAPPPKPANPDYDADGNLTPEALKRRLADFNRRRQNRP